jgi:hypothetical protein
MVDLTKITRGSHKTYMTGSRTGWTTDWHVQSDKDGGEEAEIN